MDAYPGNWIKNRFAVFLSTLLFQHQHHFIKIRRRINDLSKRGKQLHRIIFFPVLLNDMDRQYISFDLVTANKTHRFYAVFAVGLIDLQIIWVADGIASRDNKVDLSFLDMAKWHFRRFLA